MNDIEIPDDVFDGLSDEATAAMHECVKLAVRELVGKELLGGQNHRLRTMNDTQAVTIADLQNRLDDVVKLAEQIKRIADLDRVVEYI